MSTNLLLVRRPTSSAGGFNGRYLMAPAIFLLWMLPFVTISAPEDWVASRFGTAPIMPPEWIKLIKLVGRGSAIAITLFALLGVWQHRKRVPVLRIMLPLGLFGVYSVSSTLWSPLPSTSLTQSATMVMAILFAMYIAVIWESDQDTERLIKHAALAIFLLSILLLALHFGMPRSGSLTKNSSGVLHSTNAGAAGGLCILLTLSARLLWKSPWSAWWLPIVATEAVMMMIGGNRLSLFVSGAVVGILLAITLHRGLAALLMFVFAVSAILYLAVDPRLELGEQAARDLGVFAKQGQTSNELGSLSGRSEMWEKMLNSFMDSPILGHGYFVTSKSGKIYVWYEWGNWTAHNVILQLLVTTGVVGCLLLLTGLGSIALGVASGRRRLDGARNSLLLVALASLWFVGWSFLNESFMGPLQPETVVFALMLGVAAGMGASAQERAVEKGNALPVTPLRNVTHA